MDYFYYSVHKGSFWVNGNLNGEELGCQGGWGAVLVRNLDTIAKNRYLSWALIEEVPWN